ncbi:MAG: hypothetical protein ABUL60_16385 [Myxococcales bacterium]
MATHALATWYIYGIGVRKNLAVAARLEAKAARAGIAEAAFNLAYSYESGKGVEKDERQGLRLYRRAARLGDHDAVYAVGRCIFYGVGGPRTSAWGRNGSIEQLARSRRSRSPENRDVASEKNERAEREKRAPQ